MGVISWFKKQYFTKEKSSKYDAKIDQRSPKEIIERGNPRTEQAYIKFPGREIINVDVKGLNKYNLAFFDSKKVRKLMKRFNREEYREIHTHARRNFPEHFDLDWAIPSYGDMKRFLEEKNVRTMVIVQQNTETGEVEGSCYIRKKDIKKSDFELADLLPYESFVGKIKSYREENINQVLENICKKLNLQYSFIPSQGYRLQKEVNKEVKFIKETNESSLERRITSIVAIFILSLSLFLSTNLTGFSVANLTTKSLNIIGIVLFLASLIGLFLILNHNKYRKNKWR